MVISCSKTHPWAKGGASGPLPTTTRPVVRRGA
jgi:hypothetical protein